MQRALLAMAVSAVATLHVCPSLASAAPDEPRIDPGRPVDCLSDGDGRVWRVQCSPDGDPAKVCVYAPDHELDEAGTWLRPLERTRGCDRAGVFDQAKLRADGFTLVRGLADAPRGWMRDRRGRVFQVTFDLHRRLYAGVSWTPGLRDASGEPAADRTALDFGLFEYERTTGDARTGFRHRLRVAEGRVQLAPFGADATLLHYDFSRRSVIPFVRLTTFWGTPRRHDIGAHIGAWVELGNLHIDEVEPGRRETLLRYATLHMTWDVWRSAADMSSFVRLRGGVGGERTVASDADDAGRYALTPALAADADLTLDDDGFHHVTVLAQLERPQFAGAARERRASATRAQARLAYEVILVAVNDQPVTLRLAGEAEYRNDVPDAPAGWDLRAVAGLRLSLWAPAR